MAGTKKVARLALSFSVLLLLLVSPGASSAQPSSQPSEIEEAAEKLAEPASQKAALIELGGMRDPSVPNLLKAIQGGALYRWKGRLVILGQDGELKNLRGEPLFNERGRPVPVDEVEDAVALEEQYFGLIQRILERWALLSPNRERRKSAAFKLGNSGDLSVMSFLSGALRQETNREVKAVMAEALWKLKLLAPEPSERARAAQFLGHSRSEAALPRLRAMLEQERDPGVRSSVKEAIEHIDSFVFRRNLVGYLFNGISLSSVLLIMSLGLAITFGLMGIINMAHGEMLMIGAYSSYVVQELFAIHFPHYQDYYFVLALPLSFLVAGSVGLLLERGIIRHLYGRPLETLIVTWGIGMILQQSARLYFGDQTSVNPPTWFRGGLEVMRGLIFPWSRIFIVLLSLSCLVTLYLLLHRSYAGLRVRAVMQNRDMASCVGVSTRRIDALTFALGTALAGIAGCALSLIGTVDPEVGKTYIVDSFMVVVLGGVGKLLGTVVASFVIGFSNKILEPAIGGTAAAIYAKVVILLIVIWFLQAKPTGLFPAKGRTAEVA